MVDASPGSSPDALADKLAGVMAVNSLSAESMLARFFDGDALASHLASDLGKSGKGNPATLAARIVAQWKPGRGTPAGNPPARKEKKRKNEEDEDEDEEGASARGGVEKDAADAGAERRLRDARAAAAAAAAAAEEAIPTRTQILARRDGGGDV